MKLKDRVALVTGGGSGIGRAISLLFAEEGATVAVNDVVLEAAQKTVAEFPAGSPAGHAIHADVADGARVRAMFAEIDERFGRLDVLVNNAGIAEATPERIAELNRLMEAIIVERASGQEPKTHLDTTQEMTDEEWARMLAVHLFGTFSCTREALKIMSRQGRGSIVNMSSVAALGGIPGAAHYGAAKAGILGFTRSVAREVGSRGIRVNAICPGWIDTPMTAPFSDLMKMYIVGQTPLGRPGDPREVAQAALFLASDDSSFITGQWLSPNGGFFIG